MLKYSNPDTYIMTDTERVGDIVKGVVPAIWISLGLVVLLCAIFCTLGVFSGKADIRDCTMACYIFGGILVASGYLWYKQVTK
jgi:hypothetical protein